MLDLCYRPWWLAGAWLIALALVVTSLLPGPVVDVVQVWDKGEHFIGYGLLAGWCVGIVRPERYLTVVLLAIGLGIGVEIAQGFLTTTRFMDPADGLANALGAGLAWAAARLGLGGWAQRVERFVRGRPPRS